MKKTIAIFLTILYLASFSGMLLGADCSVTEDGIAGATNIAISCNTPDHSQEDKSHPLLQFCSLIEVHKEVLVSGYSKSFRSDPVSLVTTNHLVYSYNPHSYKQVYQPTLVPKDKLFITHRVLLI